MYIVWNKHHLLLFCLDSLGGPERAFEKLGRLY